MFDRSTANANQNNYQKSHIGWLIMNPEFFVTQPEVGKFEKKYGSDRWIFQKNGIGSVGSPKRGVR